jgi:hypothetical protein
MENMVKKNVVEFSGDYAVVHDDVMRWMQRHFKKGKKVHSQAVCSGDQIYIKITIEPGTVENVNVLGADQ